MPRRRKIVNPTQHTYTSQSTDSPSANKPTAQSSQPVQPTTHQQSQSTVETDAYTKYQSILNRAKSMVSRTYEVNMRSPCTDATDDDHDYRCECSTKQISSDMTTRPLIICGNACVVGIKIKRSGHNITNVEILTNRPLTSKEVSNDLPRWFQTQFLERINETIRQEFQVKRGVGNDHMIALVMTTEYTTQESPMPLKWTHQPQSCQMTAVIRSLVCLVDHEAEWEIFLRDINQFVARSLLKSPIHDSAGQQAIEVILSNHERKLLITLKFAQPCSPPNRSWNRSISKDFFALLTNARQKHHDTNPYDMSNDRSMNVITEYMMTEMEKPQ